MKILMTGGAGFIGSNFIKWLLQHDSSVHITNLDALTYAGNLESLKNELANPRHNFVKGNICDSKLVRSLVAEADAVLNFAAESHVDRSIDGPRIFMDTNIQGTFELLEAVRASGKDIRYLQVSTDEVYGSLGPTGLFHETTPLAPNSPYSSSKASADLLVRAYQHTYGMDTITTRCSNNYGPFQFPEKLIPLMIKNAKDDKRLPVYGDGMNVRDWIYVTDHCEGIWAALKKGKSGEVYNFGGKAEYPNIQIIKKILSLLGKNESLIEYVKDRPGHDKRYAMACEKAEEELGWTPKTDFEAGLQKTVSWYLENQPWVQSVTSGSYQDFYNRWYNRQ
jgi:dTDP-glucose 4,6-dehydratase